MKPSSAASPKLCVSECIATEREEFVKLLRELRGEDAPEQRASRYVYIPAAVSSPLRGQTKFGQIFDFEY